MFFRITVDVDRIPDIEVQVIPDEGWTLLNGTVGLNKGSLNTANHYAIASFHLVPNDRTQVVAGRKYYYTMIITYNGEEIVKERWSFVMGELADPLTNTVIAMTKEG